MNSILNKIILEETVPVPEEIVEFNNPDMRNVE